MSVSAGLLNFTAREPEEIVTEMYRIRKRILSGEKIEMPRVTLFLWPEKREVTGFIVDIKNENGTLKVALQLSNDYATTGIFFTYMNSISGVIVHEIERYEAILTEVTSTSQMNRVPVFTKLDLKRAAEISSATLTSFLGTTPISYSIEGTLPNEAQALFVIGNLITDVTACLVEIAETPAGKESIASAIQQIIFNRADGKFDVQFNDKTLIVSGKFDSSYTTTTGRWKLKDKLESIL